MKIQTRNSRKAVWGAALLGASTLGVLGTANAADRDRGGRGDQQFHTTQQYRGDRDDQRFDQARNDQQFRDDHRYENRRDDDHRYDNHGNDTGKIIGAGILGAVLGAVLSR